jgi:dihydrofolate synthase/folylpolyglutamate synthase
VVVFAAMADKPWPAMLAHLLPRAAELVITRVGRRGLDPDGLVAAVGRATPVRAVPDACEAVRSTVARAAADDAVLITGSLFLAGEAYAALAPGTPLFEVWNGWGE